jgi:hypothetical protein
MALDHRQFLTLVLLLEALGPLERHALAQLLHGIGLRVLCGCLSADPRLDAPLRPDRVLSRIGGLSG